MVSKDKLTALQYSENFSDIHAPFNDKEPALVEANRCLFCYDAPCTKSCPTGIDVPKFIKQITTDNMKGSAHTIFVSNIFGGGCSRVCPVEKLCEGACVYNLMHEEPIAIAKLQRHATDKAILQKWTLFDRKPSSGRRVAIVGAGPAGLSCAHTLSREGVDVTVFEKESKGGGLMTFGIAAYKVTNKFCEDEVDFITALGGIHIKYDITVGVDISIEELQKEYDAVYIGFGVGLTNKLNIPGEDLEGVEDAISFIYDIRTKGYSKVPVGEKVAVIGMGMTAIDAATQAKRLGAKEVTMLYRRTEAEKNCTQVELDIAMLDGCRVIWLAAPVAIAGENGKVKALVCDVMKLGPPDFSGKPAPERTGDTLTLEVDMVIKATGQRPYEKLVDHIGLKHTNGKVVTGKDGITSSKGIYAGGDCVNGGKEVVDAVQAGKEGAHSILEYLHSL